MEQMSEEDVCTFVRAHNLGVLVDTLTENQVDGASLMTIVEDGLMLKELVPKIGVRAKLKYVVTQKLKQDNGTTCSADGTGTPNEDKYITGQQRNTPSLEEVKKKLQIIKAKRNSSEMNPSTSSHVTKKPRKTTYIIQCGVKEKKGSEWIQSRRFRTVKLTFGITDTLETVKLKLAEEFELAEENMIILNMNNEIVADETSVYEYVQDNKKYIGTTRVYLGISEKNFPTDSSVEENSVSNNHVSTAESQKENEPLQPEHVKEGEEPSSDLSAAISCIKKEFEEIDSRNEDLELGELSAIDTTKFCPVYLDPKVAYFMSDNKKSYDTVTSGWGKFVCIPVEDMNEFEEFKQQEKCKDIFIVDAAMIYFLSNAYESDSETVKVTEVAASVWKLSSDVATQFIQWKEKIHLEFNNVL